MTSLKAFGFNIDSNGEKIIRAMATVVSPNPIDITDLAVFNADFSKEDIVFVFGDRTRREIGDKPAGLKLYFPEVYKLDATFGEKEERQQAYDKLLRLKKVLSAEDRANTLMGTDEQCSRTTITEEILPELSSSEILQYLKAALRRQGTKEWLGSTKNGKLIRLTLEQEEGKADVNMTFAEMYLLRLAMETLQVKELEIVYRPGINQSGGSYGSRSSNDR